MILQGRVLILLQHKSGNTIKFNLIQFQIDVTDLIRLDLGGSNVVFVEMSLELDMATSTKLTTKKCVAHAIKR